jgi:hypothetical protein
MQDLSGTILTVLGIHRLYSEVELIPIYLIRAYREKYYDILIHCGGTSDRALSDLERGVAAVKVCKQARTKLF